MALTRELILGALSTVMYPGTKRDIVSSKMVSDDISISGNAVTVTLVFPRATDPFLKSTCRAAEAAIHYHVSGDVAVTIRTEYVTAPTAKPTTLLPTVKHVLAVSSGKGGVGKSTVSVNLAIALRRLGYRVGLFDADVYGPSIPKMCHVEDAQLYGVDIDGRQLIEPIEQYGVQLLSIGFMVKAGVATVWRGPMATSAVRQLLGDTHWGDLDYFIIDTPPGTSDIHLTLLQALNITGAIIVSTPQQVALADARKGIDMYRNEKVNVPILGLVENMSWFTPAELPENRYYLFGRGGAEALAQELGVPLLAQIPLVQSLCESGDAGVPVALDAESTVGQAFLSLAQSVVTIVNRRDK